MYLAMRKLDPEDIARRDASFLRLSPVCAPPFSLPFRFYSSIPPHQAPRSSPSSALPKSPFSRCAPDSRIPGPNNPDPPHISHPRCTMEKEILAHFFRGECSTVRLPLQPSTRSLLSRSVALGISIELFYYLRGY